MRRVSELIRATRIKYSLTQAELARTLGVTKQAISAWERGENGLRDRHLDRFCTLFSLDYSAIRAQLDQEEI